MNNSPLIATENLSKTYSDGSVRALKGVTIAIQPGEYVAVMGPSGSGKSTLRNLLGALDRPSKGKVLYKGQSILDRQDLDAYRARHIAFVFQSFYLLPTLTALENVQIAMFESPLKPSERIIKAK